jgi:hypothetical protein
VESIVKRKSIKEKRKKDTKLSFIVNSATVSPSIAIESLLVFINAHR